MAHYQKDGKQLTLYQQDTIAAIATPKGNGGVGIVRISGNDALSFAEIVSKKSTFKSKPRYAITTNIYDLNDEIIDQGIIIYFNNPFSFTGEDVVEIHGHGGMVVMDMILERVISLGARMANPGEFSLRAYLNNKIDLVQAESIADLIESSTRENARLAVRSLEGEFSRIINETLKYIIEIRMFIETSIDFIDEDIEFIENEAILTKIIAIKNKLNVVISNASTALLMKKGIKLVITGKPNAGKSSLLNLLSGRESAIVTDIPGTTRDLIHESINLDGLPLHIVDTAGIRESTDRIEMEGINRAKRELLNADHILWLVDDSINEKYNIEELDEINAKITIVKNKIDISGHTSQLVENLNYSNKSYSLIYISAKNGLGINLLKDHIRLSAGIDKADSGQFNARARHVFSLKNTLRHIDIALMHLSRSAQVDILAEELRLAQNELSEITGEFSSDDLLGRIFSNFCIGK